MSADAPVNPLDALVVLVLNAGAEIEYSVDEQGEKIDVKHADAKVVEAFRALWAVLT